MVFSPSRPAADQVSHPSSEEPPSVSPRPGVRVDDQPVADLSKAPLPNRGTLRRRRSLPRQALRFVAFNTRIMRMVISGHKGSH